tara:strand:- start:368 stop:532 length:165 start_codon:yes stop_codon:yes gene_type:complete
MDIIKYIKDVINITLWFTLILIISIFILFVHLLVLLTGGLIFIYEEIKGKSYGR